MSETDNFINEVSDEVRRDALFQYIRRYGWIAVALVLLLVGGAAWNEYQKAQQTAAAQNAGDTLIAAMSADDNAARIAALSGADLEGPSSVVGTLLLANAQIEDANYAAATDALGQVVTESDVPQIYADIAALKAAMLPSEDIDARAAALEALAQPGAPFALLAQEQLALMAVDSGDVEGAIEGFKNIAQDASATRGLRERAQAMYVALGGDLEAVQSGQ